MMRSKQISAGLSMAVLVIVTGAGFILWDMHRLDRDFSNLHSILKSARLDAIFKDTTIVVNFNDKIVTVTDQKDQTNLTATIPSMGKVDYDTTIGKDMIVYTWRGTSDYNKKIHGGEIMLKSLLGLHRYLHVNCTGMVREGRYPEGS